MPHIEIILWASVFASITILGCAILWLLWCDRKEMQATLDDAAQWRIERDLSPPEV